MTKATIDAKIFKDVVEGGMTKVAAAKKYGISARSIGRACQRHLASSARKSDAQCVFLKVDNKNLKVGDKVKLRDDSRFANQSGSSNPIDVEGKVTRVSGHWIDVAWSNDTYNTYGKSGLHLMKGYCHLPHLELRVGDKVHLNSRSCYAGRLMNPVDEVGEITSIDKDGKRVSVKFLSCKNAYPLNETGHLYLVERASQSGESCTKTHEYFLQGGGVVVVTPAPCGESLPVGTRVVLSNDCPFAHCKDGKGTNPVGVLGTVRGIYAFDDSWQTVEWDNGFKNNYPFEGYDQEAYGNDLLVVTFPESKLLDQTPSKSVMEALESGDSVEYISTCSSIVLTLNGESEIVEETHPNFKAIQIAIVSGDFKQAFALMNIRKSIESFTQGAITIKGEKLFYGTIEIHSTIAQRILELMRNGDEGFKSMVNFFEKLMENPSRNSVDQLWGFISHNDIEIDEEGYIIGWKRVTQTPKGLFDSRTKRVPNNIGNIVQMPRWMVDADKNVTCSQGLHVGAWDYVESFSGNAIIKVRVHPRDVVSVPVDYNDQKMRVCGYESLNAVDLSRNVIDIDTKEPAEIVVVGSAGELISRKPR